MSDPDYPDDIRRYDHDERSPFHPDPPEAVCQKCGSVWFTGQFHEDWLSDLVGTDPVEEQMPKTCPICDTSIYAPDLWDQLQDEHGSKGARAILGVSDGL